MFFYHISSGDLAFAERASLLRGSERRARFKAYARLGRPVAPAARHPCQTTNRIARFASALLYHLPQSIG
jgi:hypothetical protein